LDRASDHLFNHQQDMENPLFGAVETVFNLNPVVTLYDLTHTSCEGEPAGPPKATRGHAKEQRSDTPLLTLGAVRDSRGVLGRTEIVPGHVVEARMLETMRTALDGPQNGSVIRDQGIVTEETLAWMRTQGSLSCRLPQLHPGV